MNTTGKIQNKGQVTIPTVVRRQAGLAKGDLVNFIFQRGRIIMTPTLIIDRSAVTDPRRSRKEILKGLAQAVDELRQDAKEKGIDKMSKADINRAVAAMRRDLKKTSKQPRT